MRTHRRYVLGIQKRKYRPGTRRWTEDEVRELKRLYKAGKPDSEIAAKLGRDVQSVGVKRRALGLKREPRRGRQLPVTDRQLDRAMKRILKGEAVSVVAKSMGVSNTWLRQQLSTHPDWEKRTRFRQQPLRGALLNRVLRLREEGLTVREISAQTGVVQHRIWYVLDRVDSEE